MAAGIFSVSLEMATRGGLIYNVMRFVCGFEGCFNSSRESMDGHFCF